MADSVAKGQEFYDRAQKKLKSFSFFGKRLADVQLCAARILPTGRTCE